MSAGGNPHVFSIGAERIDVLAVRAIGQYLFHVPTVAGVNQTQALIAKPTGSLGIQKGRIRADSLVIVENMVDTLKRSVKNIDTAVA